MNGMKEYWYVIYTCSKIITIKYTIITTIYNIGMMYTQISRYSDQVFLHSYIDKESL